MYTSDNSSRPRNNPDAPAGDRPKLASLASIPSMVTFVQLGRKPFIATCPNFPLENGEGAALGVGATPGLKSAAWNKSRPFRGSSRRATSEITPPTDELMLSTVV